MGLSDDCSWESRVKFILKQNSQRPRTKSQLLPTQAWFLSASTAAGAEFVTKVRSWRVAWALNPCVRRRKGEGGHGGRRDGQPGCHTADVGSALAADTLGSLSSRGSTWVNWAVGDLRV